MENVEKFKAELEVDLDENVTEEVQSEDYLDKLEAEYDKYAAECEAAMEIALLKINIFNDAFKRTGKRNPFDRIEYRKKTFKSVRGKCRDRGYALTMSSIKENVRDIGGIRIVTKHLNEIPLVIDLIRQIQEISILSVKDYVETPKDGGYKSVHLNCQVGVYDPFGGLRMIPLEIQIRTLCMDLWATMDHDINYKALEHHPEVVKRLQHIAEILDQLEDEYKELSDYVDNKSSDTALQ